MAACTTAPAPSASAPIAVAAAAPPKLLLISIDGLRADALDRGLTPNLQRLIDGGDLALALVAQRAGFSSARRMNAAFAKLYGRSPASLRRKRPPGVMLQ